MLLRRVMELDGTYLMHNNERLSFRWGYQVGVYVKRPTFFLFDKIQTYVLKTMGEDEIMNVVGNIFSVASHEIENAIQNPNEYPRIGLLENWNNKDNLLNDLYLSLDGAHEMFSASNFNDYRGAQGKRDLVYNLPDGGGGALNVFGGIWEDEKEQVHVDVSTWVKDLDAALALAKKYNQLSVYDWAKGVCIEVN